MVSSNLHIASCSGVCSIYVSTMRIRQAYGMLIEYCQNMRISIYFKDIMFIVLLKNHVNEGEC